MIERRIEVPNAAAIRQAGALLRIADWSIDRDRTVVVFHPGYCHMQPWVVAALAAWGYAHRAAGGSISVENPERAAYGWRFGLGDYLRVPHKRPSEHEEAGRFVALRRVGNSDDLAALLADIVPLLHLGAQPEQAKAVQYAVSEMVRNTLEHSRSLHGAVVCAQLYGAKKAARKYISIGVADTGIGVMRSLLPNYPDLQQDSEAVLKAIQPGVTGALRGMYGASDNAGAGLFITRRLSDTTGGYFAVGSHKALFRSSLAQRRPPDPELVMPISSFPGTLVCVEIGLREEDDFSEMLGLARDAFFQRLRMDRAKISRRVRFS